MNNNERKLSTLVINFIGSPGAGKTTHASRLFSHIKEKEEHTVEFALEYVKKWAWSDKKVGIYDQFYISGKQAQLESILYDKVDMIISDSPLLLSCFYEEYHTKQRIVYPSIKNFIKFSKNNGIHRIYFYVHPTKTYNPKGRYETKDQAKNVHEALYRWMKVHGEIETENFFEIDSFTKVEEIYSKVENYWNNMLGE